jgi:hypothetical protein
MVGVRAVECCNAITIVSDLMYFDRRRSLCLEMTQHPTAGLQVGCTTYGSLAEYPSDRRVPLLQESIWNWNEFGTVW